MIQKTTLANGVVLISEAMPGVESVALGVWVDAGSVDECADEFGVAHYLEHMLFKGTTTRSAFALAEEIEDVGGQINAFTERETTSVYVHLLAEHLPVALELLADMICHSTFCAEEFDRERQVILEEILKYESLPEERIQDDIMTCLWHEGGLGHPILGTEASVRQLSREHVINCWKRHFAADRVLITAAGKVEHADLLARVETLFAELPPPVPPLPAGGVGTRQPHHLSVEDSEEQVNFCWGARSYAAHDARNFALSMIDATLGGSTTSRLFQEIREKRGLAYDISSYNIGFRNTGLICATGACSPETFPEVLSLTQQEIERLLQQGMSARELARAKEQMKSGLALSLEGTTDRMRMLALQQLTWGQIYPVSQLIARMNKVTLDDVNEILVDIFNLKQWSFVAIGALEEEQVTRLLG